MLLDRKDSLVKIDRAIKVLYLDPELSKPSKEQPRVIKKLTVVDIAMIGAPGFHRAISKKGSTIFVTSLNELDTILEDRYYLPVPAGDTPGSETEGIKKTLLPQHHDLVDVFLKMNSDELPPYREGHDAKIERTEPNNINYGPLYKMSTAELEAVKQYIVDNLAKGFIQPSNAPLASPILMAEKPDGGLRFCIDYRKLNAITRKDRYPIPMIDEVLERVSRAKIFTKLDIRQGFHRLRMDPESEELTTFRSRFGSYKYKVNENEQEHELHVRIVLERLQQAGLQVAIYKCKFHVTRTKYLGFIISTEGIEVDSAKIAAIVNWATPTTVKGVQSFLGFYNFYRRFIRGYSRIARALNRLTRRDVPFEWTSECREAFNKLKEALTSTPMLRHYDPRLPTRIETDASKGVIAGILQQLREDLWHPVA
ncbi:reverse transcriptase family protein [Aspergillus affinis]|uniref:reverse transcriptase family protein n=1 Tax=Aspergillus affinis TaxID=1070780 RepID=UPI0022FEC78D|nr:gag/polymerase/env polyprotein [Aspergillus affinis]KAI9035588.1 gag/polymerase/env polyprotein [Aspergillus affinis]